MNPKEGGGMATGDGRFAHCSKAGDEYFLSVNGYVVSAGPTLSDKALFEDKAAHINAASDARLEAFRARIVQSLEALRAKEFEYIPDGRWAIDEALKVVKESP